MSRSKSTPVAYFDCFHGISGDMTLGALVDAGLPLATLKRELGKIPLEGYRLRKKSVLRGAIAATKVDVVQTGLAPGAGKDRHLRDIEVLLAKSSLDEAVLSRIRDAFHRLAVAEAAVHGTTIEKVHFHEVGAIDAIVDIAGAMIGFDWFGVEAAFAASVPVGSGTVECRHGVIPVPGPATLEILRGAPVRFGEPEVELTTPTGAAILAAMEPDFRSPDPMTVGAIGIGAGDRNDASTPNVLRLVFGDRVGGGRRSGGVYQVEANIDDSTPEVLGHALERLLAAGALDAWAVPVQMKKGRPAVTLAALVSGDRLGRVEETLFAETSTFGVRPWPVHRRVLDRETRKVETALGAVVVKVGSLDGAIVSIAPEFESCRKIADRTGVALRDVYDAARAACEPKRRAKSGRSRSKSGTRATAASSRTSAKKRK